MADIKTRRNEAETWRESRAKIRNRRFISGRNCLREDINTEKMTPMCSGVLTFGYPSIKTQYLFMDVTGIGIRGVNMPMSLRTEQISG